MAVIIRNRLTGEAKNIADKGIGQAKNGMYKQNFIALGAQKDMVASQQQGFISATNATLGQVQDNIYKAQRSAKADSAMLGYSSAIANLRDTSEIQGMVSQELNNVINQAEQGAISIAGQQSSIAKQEIQLASDEILGGYVDNLISTGKAKQDIGRQIGNGLTGALTGAVKGLLGGAGATWGAKTLLNPTKGILKKMAAGGVLAGVGSMGANDLGGLANTGNKYYGDGRELYSKETAGNVTKYGMLAGVMAGGGLRAFDRYGGLLNSSPKVPGQLALSGPGVVNHVPYAAPKVSLRSKALGSKLFPASSKYVAKEGLSTLGKVGGRFKHMKTSGVFKMNPWVAAASAGIGALVGGISGGMEKKYTLDLNSIQGDSTYQQFEDMGLDMNQLVDMVYNK